MKEITVDVIIPVYRPGERFGELLKRLDAQTQPVNRYIIMNTEQAYWDRWLLKRDTVAGKSFWSFM